MRGDLVDYLDFRDPIDVIERGAHRAFLIGALAQASVKTPGAILDPYSDTPVRLSPAQLAELDRKLSPAEQILVDAWQEQQANLQLATERKQVYTDPRTGERRNALATYIPSGPVPRSAPKKIVVVEKQPDGGFLSRIERSVKEHPIAWAGGAAGAVALIIMTILLARRR